VTIRPSFVELGLTLDVADAADADRVAAAGSDAAIEDDGGGVPALQAVAQATMSNANSSDGLMRSMLDVVSPRGI
jgi:hypothetical protein